jgi:hypothetical protein
MRLAVAAMLASVCGVVVGCDGPERPLGAVSRSPTIRKNVCFSPCVVSLTYAPMYVASVRMTDLGLLPGNSYSEAFDVNDYGQIAGASFSGGTPGAVFWNTPSQIKPLFASGVSSEATGINASGMVVGSTTLLLNGGTFTRGFTWNNGAVTLLSAVTPPNGSYFTGAARVNDAGTAVGYVWSMYADGTSNEAMAYWPLGASTAQVPVLESGASWSDGRDINNNGMIAGVINDSAFTWQSAQSASRYWWPGGFDTWATGLNDQGRASGVTVVNQNSGQEHALVIDPSGITDLGTLTPSSAATSGAWDIDELNLVVGESSDSTAAGWGTQAFLWGSDFGMYPLGWFPGVTQGASRAFGVNPNLLGDSILIVGSSDTPKASTHAALWSVTLGLKPYIVINPGVWGRPYTGIIFQDPTRYVRLIFAGGPNLDATAIDVQSLRLSHTPTAYTSVQDVDGDGKPDLVMLFSIRLLMANGDLTARTTQLTVTGNLLKTGTPITNTAPVRICLDRRSCPTDDTVAGP